MTAAHTHDAADRAGRGEDEWHPRWAVHPGEILEELIEDQRLTRRLAAKALGWPEAWVDQVVDDQHDITALMAHDLADVFGLTERMWMRLQERYSAWKLEQTEPLPGGAGGAEEDS